MHINLGIECVIEKVVLSSHCVRPCDSTDWQVCSFVNEIDKLDANDQNILVDDEATQLAGIIDFGDTLLSWQVNEIAISMAYVMLGKDEPVEAAGHMLRGYNKGANPFYLET